MQLKIKISWILVAGLSVYALLCYRAAALADHNAVSIKVLGSNIQNIDTKHKYAASVYALAGTNLLQAEKGKNSFLFGWVYDSAFNRHRHTNERARELSQWVNDYEHDWRSEESP